MLANTSSLRFSGLTVCSHWFLRTGPGAAVFWLTRPTWWWFHDETRNEFTRSWEMGPRKNYGYSLSRSYQTPPKRNHGSVIFNHTSSLIGGDWNHGIWLDFQTFHSEKGMYFIIPTDELSPSFFRGVAKNHQPARIGSVISSRVHRTIPVQKDLHRLLLFFGGEIWLSDVKHQKKRKHDNKTSSMVKYLFHWVNIMLNPWNPYFST